MRFLASTHNVYVSFRYCYTLWTRISRHAEFNRFSVCTRIFFLKNWLVSHVHTDFFSEISLSFDANFTSHWFLSEHILMFKSDLSKVKTMAMIRNRYNQILHPALNTKREKGYLHTKIKTAQLKSQGDSSFPTAGHKAILNKLNSKSKTNRKQMNIDN